MPKEKEKLIVVGSPIGGVAVVGKEVKEVLYKEKVREIIKPDPKEKGRDILGKDSVLVLDSKTEPYTIYLK